MEASPSMKMETVILGAGPAGTGSLVWAARHGVLGDWLDAGVTIIEQSESLGGTMGRYALNADTLGGTFLECLDGPRCEPELVALRRDPLAIALSDWRDRLPPLELAGQFLDRLGVALRAMIARHPRSLLLTSATARQLKLECDGTVTASIEHGGSKHEIAAGSAVIALGGVQSTAWSEIEIAPGMHLGRWRRKLLPSEALLVRGGAEHAARHLSGKREPRVVIIGGAHSAFSSAWLMLNHLGIGFGSGGIRILHRNGLRIFYPSREAAVLDGYTFDEDDVCSATGRVFRLAGLRGDGREICRRMRGLGGLEREDRVVAQAVATLDRREFTKLLDAADLIVCATGYRLKTIPVLGEDDTPIALARVGPTVDHNSRVLTAGGHALENVLGVGLGSGFKPWGTMAGEVSFTGQQNSLWLYQNGLGQSIHDSTRRYAARTLEPLYAHA
jgi:hypothetical protein